MTRYKYYLTHVTRYKYYVTHYMYYVTHYMYYVTHYKYYVTHYKYYVTHYMYYVTHYKYYVTHYNYRISTCCGFIFLNFILFVCYFYILFLFLDFEGFFLANSRTISVDFIQLSTFLVLQ